MRMSLNSFTTPEVLDQHEFSALDKLFEELGKPPATILDLGANIGLASAYFASRYPDAKIAAVEPNLHNFRLAVLNTKFSSNVVPLFGGIWSSEVTWPSPSGRMATSGLCCARAGHRCGCWGGTADDSSLHSRWYHEEDGLEHH